MKKVRFMGISGSGASSIAIIAKGFGYNVFGCDINLNNYYSNSLITEGIEIFQGRNKEHIRDVDILAVSPNLLLKSESIEELD